MIRIAITAVLLATIATAQTLPPIVHEIESRDQQTQALEDISLQQGANASYRVRVKTDGRQWSLVGLSAEMDIRSSATSTNRLTLPSVTTVTNATPHYFQFALTPAQTGDAASNWLYSVKVTAGNVRRFVEVALLRISISADKPASDHCRPSVLTRTR